MKNKKYPRKKTYLSGKRIFPDNLTGTEGLDYIIEEVFLAYNSGRLREGCRLFVEKMLKANVTIGASLAGALTPAGLGRSCIVPLINAGFIDWIVSTGANLYHDLHFAFGKPLHTGTHLIDDIDLHNNDIVRIYDILFSFTDCLDATDRILSDILKSKELQKTMGTAELHYRLGRYCNEWEEKKKIKNSSVLAAAYRADVPVFTSSPGDSAIGMNIAGKAIEGNRLKIDPTIDVNDTAAIVLDAKRSGGKSGVLLIGGGSPKNFILQTEPQIQEILHIKELGHDYFFQITDARVDTGGLSGATPHEAVSWGKIDPRQLPNTIVCYTDFTIALPIITYYALAKHRKRPLKRLYARRKENYSRLVKEYFANKKRRLKGGE